MDDTLYPQINNDIEHGLFENVINSYYLNCQIKDDFQCTKTCYTHDTTASTLHSNLYYGNIPQQKALHPCTQEVVQLSHIFR